jgi:AcrR family transcriptional regulator
MPDPNRLSPKGSRTRAVVLDSAEGLMLEEGYAAVTYRNVAARAGVTAANVQYYFGTIDELFLALLRQRTQGIIERLQELSDSDQPLRAIWRYAGDAHGSALLMEFLALANHRKAIRDELGEGGERVRQAQVRAVTKKLKEYGVDTRMFPPPAVVFLMTAAARMRHVEEGVGTHTGHVEATRMVERLLDQVEPRKRRSQHDREAS